MTSVLTTSCNYRVWKCDRCHKTADGESVNANTDTFTTLKHIGLNAKAFKQSSLYIAELLSDADTVSIS